jgi:hypothetical protein
VRVANDGWRFGVDENLVLHDVALGIDCAPEVATDGVVRCLPVGDDPRVATAYATDSSCANTTVAVAKGATMPVYARRSACSHAIHSIGSTRATADVYEMYLPSIASVCPATCVSNFKPTTDVFDLGPEIPPSTFAPVSLELR